MQVDQKAGAGCANAPTPAPDRPPSGKRESRQLFRRCPHAKFTESAIFEDDAQSL